MNSPYTIHIKTPSGEAMIGSDTWEDIVRLMPYALKKDDPGRSQDKDFEGRLNAFYSHYRRSFGVFRKRKSPIELRGLEIDIARCFLQGMTARQTVEFLKNDKSFKTSTSAVGRYWQLFFSLGHERDILEQ